MKDLTKRLKTAQNYYAKYEKDPVKGPEVLDKCENLVTDFEKAGYERAYIWGLIIFAKELAQGKK